jgi:sulfane dehydrogenase subunit SoxC
MRRMAIEHPPTQRAPHGGLLDRRAFLGRGLQFGTVFAATSAAATESTADASGPTAARSPPRLFGQPFTAYGQPSAHERQVLRSIGLNGRGDPGNGAAWSPLEQLEGTLTPNGLHFVRSHAGTPAIDPAAHRLVVHGMVRQPLSFSAEALLRYPMQSRQLAIECGGNSSAGWFEEPVQRTVGLTHGLVSCAEWTGVPLAMLLDECGADPRATWVVATGADASALQMSVPIDKMRGDCFIALYQNGERLRPENGYPMRLVVPGWKGVLNVKWLAALQLADQPAMARNETARYTELLPSGQAQQFTFAMGVKSVITTPSHGQRLSGPDVYEIKGLAWSGSGAVRSVDVSADGGSTWVQAALQGPRDPLGWTRFRAAWHWDGRPALLQSRATDTTGQMQPSRDALVQSRGRRSFYHYNAIVTWAVDERGIVLHSYGEV